MSTTLPSGRVIAGKPCDASPKCNGTAEFSTHCGAYVCDTCERHHGKIACFCGWKAGGGNGREYLEECGETIEPDDWPDDSQVW